MIILDTNVLSALMRDRPDAAVITWLDEQPAQSIRITAITVLEVRTGLELLRASRRRTQLESAFEQLLRDDLDGRVLAFDTAAANSAGIAVAAAQRRGKSADIRDCQIAGIAVARRAILATGNIGHFEALGVTVVDPWGEGCDRSPTRSRPFLVALCLTIGRDPNSATHGQRLSPRPLVQNPEQLAVAAGGSASGNRLSGEGLRAVSVVSDRSTR